jgi:hypothetical protein
MVRTLRRVWLCACLAVLSATTACTGGSSGGNTAVTGTPLPTTAPGGNLLCGHVPESSAKTLLGAERVTARGQVDRDQKLGVTGGMCWIYPDGASTPALMVTLYWAEDKASEILAKVAAGRGDYHYPASIAPGYAINRSESRYEGKSAHGATSIMLWGNLDVDVAIQAAGEGRDPVKDAVALSQQVVHVLKLPKTPTKPYPSITATAGPSASSS